MLARWGKDDEKVLEESIAAIQSESDYMKKLVEELLFLARGEIGRNPFEPAPMSLTELIRDVCEESAMIDTTHLWQFDPASPEISLTADAKMLKQCARILSENARKYTPEGGTIKLTVFTDPSGNPCFRIQDEGIGIAEADAPRIFDRFYRSDPARDRNSGGTGLGLSIAKWIVDRHNGYFELLSREGIGTRITVTLPPDSVR
jgi:signal transduction histidine kinase